MRYYAIADIVFRSAHPIVTFLGDYFTAEGAWVDPRQYIKGEQCLHHDSLKIDMRFADDIVPDIFYGPFATLIARERVANAIKTVAPDDVQLIPLAIAGQDETFAIVNAVSACDCIDEKRSLVQHSEDWPNCPSRKYDMVLNLKIDPLLARGLDIFRVRYWEVSVIISDRVTSILRANRVSNLILDPV